MCIRDRYSGKRIKGVITSIAKNEVQVDIGGKQSGFIPASELSDDPNMKPEDIVSKGEELDLVVLKVNDQDGIVTLSKKRLDAEKGFEEIITAKDENKTMTGVITDVVRGGALVLTLSLIHICNKLTTVQRIRVTDEQIGQDDVLDKVLNMDIEKIRRTLEETSREDFYRAVDGIVRAKSIYIIGSRSAAAVARFMAFYFNLIFENVKLVHTTSTSEMFEHIMRLSLIHI